MTGLGTTDVSIDVRGSTVETSDASKLMESISLVANTQRATEKFKTMNQGVPLEVLKSIETVTREILDSGGKCLRAGFLTPVEGKRDRWGGVSPRTGDSERVALVHHTGTRPDCAWLGNVCFCFF
jgi:hypothetical protein